MPSMMRMMIALSIVVLPGVALADDYTVGDLQIDHPVARATAQTAMTSAGYLTIANTGTQADTLIGVEADFPRVEVHETFMADGMMNMQEVGPLLIPAGEKLTLERGGLHVMFMGLNGDPFEVGEEVPATLIFEKAGRLDIVFDVEDLSATVDHNAGDHNAMHDGATDAGGMSHDDMNHDDMSHDDMNHDTMDHGDMTTEKNAEAESN